MNTRRVTANLPAELLQKAMETTGEGITETIVEGLEQLRKRRFAQKALALRGKLHLNVETDKSRGRRHR